jgi:hypothetical protein
MLWLLGVLQEQWGGEYGVALRTAVGWEWAKRTLADQADLTPPKKT